MKSKTKPTTNDAYPMRINKYLSHKGVSTRKGADELIVNRKIYINGRVAVLGDKVSENDKVEVKGKSSNKNFVYLAYNKPRGIVSTNPQGDEKSIIESIDTKSIEKKFGKVFPIGRIDKESHGLMILTNDGRVTDRLLNPIYEHEKEYIVQVDRKFSPGFLKHMQEGVELSDGKTKPAKVKKIKDDIFSITLIEGRNRQIRRMTEKLGYTVRDLQRTRIQNIKLGKIPKGSFVDILGEQKEEFLKSIGL